MDLAGRTVGDVGSPARGHGVLRLVLLLEVPLLLLLAIRTGVEPLVAVGLLVVPAVLVLLSGTLGPLRVRPVLVAVGFAWCHWLLVVWSGGAAEAHAHGLVVLVLLAVYRDPLPVSVLAGGLIALLLVGQLDPPLMFGGAVGAATPLLAGLVHMALIAGTVGALMLAWRTSGVADAQEHHREAVAMSDAARSQLDREVAGVYAAAARRNQSLLERQLQVIEHLEAQEEDPEVLEHLFKLDHLTTRMTREATSMLVLAGGEPTRRVNGVPPLSEVIRGAIGEVEDYTRVDVALDDDRGVEGAVVGGLVHLLSELIENAAAYSPPSSRVRVTGETTSDGGYRLHVVDEGIGLDEERLHLYNDLLANPPAQPPASSQRLGLEVVARLAGRLGLPVLLMSNEDGVGVTAVVHLTSSVLTPATPEVLDGAADVEPIAVPSIVATAVPEPDAVTQPARAGGAPGWAAAVVRTAPSSDATAHPVEERADAGHEGRRPAAATRAETRRHATARSASSWSYAGHLDQRDQPAPAAPARAFGRGSRSQVSRAAPRPQDLVRETPPPPTPSPPAAPARPAPTAPEPTGPTPPTAPAPAQPAAAAPGWVAATGQRGRAGAGDPTASELLEGVGEGASRAWDTPPEPPMTGAEESPPSVDVPAPTGRAQDPIRLSDDGGLPQRRRGASLPPGLLPTSGDDPQRSASADPVTREKAKSLLSSYQSRLQAGRLAAEEQMGRDAPADAPSAGEPTEDQAGSDEH